MALAGCRPILGIEDTRLEAGTCELMPERVFFADNLVSDTTVTLGVLTRARFEELGAKLGVTLDPDKGHALAQVVDCRGRAAEYAAVDFEPADAEVTSFITSGNELLLGTDSGIDGFVGALDLGIDEVEVSAYPDELDIESSVAKVVTRPGELSRILLAPNSAVSETPPAVDAWKCVGAIPTPVVDDATITLTIDVEASQAFVPDGAPVAGVRVAVCRDAATCAPGAGEAQSATTDASGRAELVVPTGDAGFDGHLALSGVTTHCDAD